MHQGWIHHQLYTNMMIVPPLHAAEVYKKCTRSAQNIRTQQQFWLLFLIVWLAGWMAQAYLSGTGVDVPVMYQ
jgi:hypothetical protein